MIEQIKASFKVFLIFSLLFFGCSPSQKSSEDNNLKKSKLKLLALGDSYTIGESVDPSNRWPVMLVNQLREEGFDFEDPTIIARTGWTTDELLKEIININPTGNFDIVTLLIGVNNQYRGRSQDNYKEEFNFLLEKSIDFASGKPENVFVLSIPDYGVTPFAKERDPQKISKEIDEFNSNNKAEAVNAEVNYVDITPISKNAIDDKSLLADDELHPSGKMYKLWVEKMLPEILKALNKNDI